MTPGLGKAIKRPFNEPVKVLKGKSKEREGVMSPSAFLALISSSRPCLQRAAVHVFEQQPDLFRGREMAENEC